ncbi:MAG: hypothetical protein RLZZ301_1248 [Bacteroidota bacterium]|jgi:predicted extracellular nuclease
MKSIFTIIFLASFGFYQAQQLETIAFYNVENLFDTLDGSNDDAEFLPSAKSAWNATRYNEKLTHIRQVMSELGMPVIMGFCEVENRQVLVDLLGKAQKNYGIVHYESPDARGIDVAMIYRKDLFKLKDSGILRFTLPGDSIPTTRDILWAKYSCKGETWFVLVNHWPSRRSGTDTSEPRRICAAEHAVSFIDSVQKADPAAKIVFMGDLNDHPQDKAPQLISQRLTPLITKSSGEFGGSHNYKSEWDVLDHMMVSKNAADGKVKAQMQSGQIQSYPFLITTYKGEKVPNRTYAGTNYLGGYSDHLPVSFKILVP